MVLITKTLMLTRMPLKKLQEHKRTIILADNDNNDNSDGGKQFTIKYT